MDPRKPELALPRVKELIKQYEDLEKRISKVTVSRELGELEREGVLVVQEICLVAPRLHETLMNTSRNRRTELASGINFGYTTEEKLAADIIGEENIGGESVSLKDIKVKNPAKKKTTKKGKK